MRADAGSPLLSLAWEKGKKDIVNEMAKACSSVNSKYVSCDVGYMLDCNGFGDVSKLASFSVYLVIRFTLFFLRARVSVSIFYGALYD